MTVNAQKEQPAGTLTETIAYLQRPQAIRDRAHQLFQLAQADQLEHFSCDLSKLDAVADYVIETTQQLYPDFDVPFHSRWRHFDVGGVPRLAELNRSLQQASEGEADKLRIARSQLDLVIVSVLLDAGAGSQWRYRDGSQVLSRSEGLAVASLRAFQQGLFSSDPTFPYQVDSDRLQQLSEADLAAAFQVSADNPLLGLTGRLALLQKLGVALSAQPRRFGQSPARPGNLLDYLVAKGTTLHAGDLLTTVLESFGSIWPGRVTLGHINLGDVWPHPALANREPGDNLVPFHKLSQWLTYSLIEPLTAASITVTQLNALTGLAEYRNGGLCVDLGLLLPKHSAITQQQHLPGSPVVVEWRALTIVMLDLIADCICTRLNKSPADLPLIKVIEGGTWPAGRRIAKHLRPTASPPIILQSDGTVF